MSALLHPDAAAARFGGAPAAARGDAERRLGAGAFGAVRAARDTSLNSGGEACALKAVRVPRLEYDRDEGAGGDKARNVPDQVRSSKHTRAKAQPRVCTLVHVAAGVALRALARGFTAWGGDWCTVAAQGLRNGR